MDLIECRLVDIEDYDDVMDIRDDVYGGLDYLPALYRTMMTNHTGYALAVDKTLVAFRCVTFLDDGETLLTRALRVRKEYEGRGLVHRLKDFISQENAANQRLKRKVSTFGDKTLLKKKVDQGNATLVLQKSILFYQGLVSKVVPYLPIAASTPIRILNKEDMKKLLSSQTDAERLFPQGRIIVDWIPYRLLVSNVDHFFNDFCYIIGSDIKEGDSDRLELITLAVAFRCVTFIDDGETLLTRALRVRKEYEGRGLVNRLNNFISRQNVGNQRLKRKVSTFGNKALLKKVEQGKVTLVLRKPTLNYQSLVSKVVPYLPIAASTPIRILNKADMKKLLSSQTDAERLFPQGRIIVDWIPYRLLVSNVDHFFNDFCYIIGSDIKDGDSDRLELMTLAVGYTVPKGIRYNIEIYGNLTEQMFSCHMAEHLRKCSTLERENINLVIRHEEGRHAPDIITKTMQQFGIAKSVQPYSTTMYVVEEPKILSSH